MAGASGDRNESLKETILESLTAILSPDHVTRSNGEDQIKALEVTEGKVNTSLSELRLVPKYSKYGCSVSESQNGFFAGTVGRKIIIF